MEVHSHSRQGERKKWTHYFWDFFMLFLAVTLGFFVENQREHYIEKGRAVKFARQLVLGLKSDTSIQKKVIARLGKKEQRFDSLLYFLAQPGDDDKKWIGIYRNMGDLELRLRYSTGKARLDQIKNSGSLRFFTNDSLLSLLALYESLDYLQEQQAGAEYIFISQVVTPFVISHFDKNLIQNRSRTHINRPGWDTTMIGNAIPPGFTNGVKVWEQDFANIVLTAKEMHSSPAINMRALLETARELIVLLQKEYHLE